MLKALVRHKLATLAAYIDNNNLYNYDYHIRDILIDIQNIHNISIKMLF